jgi:hypothetical protein
MSQVRFDFFKTFVRRLTAQGSRGGSGVKICGRNTDFVPEVQWRTALNTHGAGLAEDITPSNWDDWPTMEQLAELSGKANGLFHYATTALQWIKVQIEKKGKACQNTVFEQFALLGMGGLEDLLGIAKSNQPL